KSPAGLDQVRVANETPIGVDDSSPRARRSVKLPSDRGEAVVFLHDVQPVGPVELICFDRVGEFRFGGNVEDRCRGVLPGNVRHGSSFPSQEMPHRAYASVFVAGFMPGTRWGHEVCVGAALAAARDPNAAAQSPAGGDKPRPYTRRVSPVLL